MTTRARRAVERRRGAAVSERVEGYEPIETAPKDGTMILGFDGQDYAVVRWCSFDPPPKHETIKGCWELTVCGAHAEDAEWEPTHWRPIEPASCASASFLGVVSAFTVYSVIGADPMSTCDLELIADARRVCGLPCDGLDVRHGDQLRVTVTKITAGGQL